MGDQAARQMCSKISPTCHFLCKRENYKSIEELYGKDKNESEKYVPEAAAKRHRMPFSPSAHKANNVKIVVQCSECRKCRVCHTERVFKGEKGNNWSRNWKARPSYVARIFKILKIAASTVVIDVYVNGKLTCQSPMRYNTMPFLMILCVFTVVVRMIFTFLMSIILLAHDAEGVKKS